MIMEKMNNFILKNILIVVVIFVVLYFLMAFKGYSNNPTPYKMESTMLHSANSIQMADSKARSGVILNKSATSNSLKVVKNFSLSIETKNINQVRNEVETEINKVNGIIDGFYSYVYYGNELAYNFNLRIPSEQVEKTMEFFKSLGMIKNESSSAVDFAEQYSDNQNRLANLYVRRDRLRKMMEGKTEKLSDVIAVDRELTNVQTEIENLENANKKIDTNVSYSKLDLSIIPQVKIEEFNNSRWQINTSWKNAVNDFIVFGQKTTDFVFKAILFIPAVLVLLGIFVIIKVVAIKVGGNRYK